MSKCNFETECKGNGTCCLYCNYRRFCDSLCMLVDMNKPRKELEEDTNDCDWFEK